MYLLDSPRQAGIEPMLPALQADALISEPPGKSPEISATIYHQNNSPYVVWNHDTTEAKFL